jgi:hypothetical protein
MFLWYLDEYSPRNGRFSKGDFRGVQCAPDPARGCAKWCLAHHQENFLNTYFEEICSM